MQQTGNKSYFIIIAQGTAWGERIFTQFNWDTFPQVFCSHWRESASQGTSEPLSNPLHPIPSLGYDSEKNSNSSEKRFSLQWIQGKQESQGVLMQVPKQYFESPQFCLCLFHKTVAYKKSRCPSWIPFQQPQGQRLMLKSVKYHSCAMRAREAEQAGCDASHPSTADPASNSRSSQKT